MAMVEEFWLFTTKIMTNICSDSSSTLILYNGFYALLLLQIDSVLPQVLL